MRGFTSLALAGAFGMVFGASAQAADMAFPPLEGTPVTEQPIAFGTGWYLRGDAAWSRDVAPLINIDPSPAQQSTQPPLLQPTTTLAAPSGAVNGYSFDIGFGYKFNNWLRADLVYDYRHPISATSSVAGYTICPYSLVGWPSPTGTGPGYLYDPADKCDLKQNATVSRQDLLLNAYVDLGTWGGITPYVGAGAGIVRTATNSAVNYYESASGTLYNANLTATGTSFYPEWVDTLGNICGSGSNTCTSQPKISFTQQNWNKSTSSVSYGLAWALMAGFAFDVTDHLKIDLGYRYVDLGNVDVDEATSTGTQTVKKKQTSQEVRVGFRYMAD